MYRLFSVFVFIVSASAVVSGYEHGSLKGLEMSRTYRHAFTESDFDELPVCIKPGPICGGCRTLYECILIDNVLKPEKLGDCMEGYTCLQTPTTASCTKGPNPDCDSPKYIFTCHHVGIFPDPFDCKKYHMCVPSGDHTVNPISIPQTCQGSFYYDARTNLCRKVLENNKCPVVAAPCTSLGQVGLILNNPSLYFICLRQGDLPGTFPNIYLCPENKEYDLATHSCEAPAPVTGSEGKCLKVGLFYDSTSCFNYYDCAAVGGVPTRRSCASKMRFNHKTQKCVDFTCADLG